MIKAAAFYTFAKAQVSSFMGGVSDYLIMIALTEYAGIHYTISIVISGILGAVINFTINKYWSFAQLGSKNASLGRQLSKFVLVVAGSIFLKSTGTYLFSSGLAIDYRISRLIVELLVSYGFNYTLLRYWVFNRKVDH